MLLLHAARRLDAAQHTAIGVRQNLPPRLALLNPQGIVIHLRLQMLLLRWGVDCICTDAIALIGPDFQP